MNVAAHPSAVRLVTHVRTEHASRYLQQLCKHFSHKLPVTFDLIAGTMRFPLGDCMLEARQDMLLITTVSPDAESAWQLADIIERHLIRFAFREELVLDWHEDTPGEHPLDPKVVAVLDGYHERIRAEREAPRVEAPGGRDGGQDQRMRAISPDTGRFLNTLVRGLRRPTVLEIGTSFGYSTIWLAEAARSAGGRLITMELHAYKSEHAREMAERAGLSDHIEFRVGDAVTMARELPHTVDFVFLDLWKDLYVPSFDAFHEKLAPGAIVVADNMIRPGGEPLKAYATAIRAKAGITSILLPVGSGLEVSRYMP